MLWLCLRCTDLPLATLDAATPDLPRAVAEGQRVYCHDQAAAERGVAAGMPLTTARALCPELVVRLRAPAREQAMLEALAHACHHLTPMVTLCPPAGLRLVQARGERLFADVEDLARRADLDRGQLAALADAGTLRTLSAHRHQAHWNLLAIEERRPLFDGETGAADQIQLPAPTRGQDLLADYRGTGLSLGLHPMALLRGHPAFRTCARQQELTRRRSGCFLRIAGLVTGRQRPGTASGVIFLTLEDETGNTNVIVWRDVQDRHRAALLGARLLLVKGVLEHRHSVCHVIAGELQDHSGLLASLAVQSRDFH